MAEHSLGVKLFELLPPAVGESRTLVRTHEAPRVVGLDPLHEQVGYPEAVEQVTRPVLLLAGVFPHVEEVEHIGVPGLQVDGERAWPLRTDMCRWLVTCHIR